MNKRYINMKKHIKIIVSILLAVATLLILCYTFKEKLILKIEASEIKNVSVYYFDQNHDTAIPIDIDSFAKYYNSISNVSSSYGGETTPDSKIKIELYSGTIIEIYEDLHYKYSLNICIYNPGEKTKCYAGEQKQIKEILNGKYK